MKYVKLKTFPLTELCLLLSKFVIEARREDGTDFEPDTLSCYIRSIQRYLNKKGKFVLFKEMPEFRKLQDALGAKRKQLKKKGLGNKPNACKELLSSEETKLFETETFGCKDSAGLQRALWWMISKHFGFRGRDESKKLKWGDIKLAQDPETKNEILIWVTNRGTKTESGGKEIVSVRTFNPHIQATGDSQCPIKFYKVYKSHRPQEACSEESPFYLAIKYKVNPTVDVVWYRNSPLGKNEIGKFMTRAAKQANLDVSDGKKIANHTVRKTSIGRLIDNNVPESLIIQHSGHQQVESLSSYKAPSFSYQRQMSQYLSHSTCHIQSLEKPAVPQTFPACVQSTPTSGFRPVQYYADPHPQSSVTVPSTKAHLPMK